MRHNSATERNSTLQVQLQEWETEGTQMSHEISGLRHKVHGAYNMLCKLILDGQVELERHDNDALREVHSLTIECCLTIWFRR